jgi:hypothetical protein
MVRPFPGICRERKVVPVVVDRRMEGRAYDLCTPWLLDLPD